MNRRELLCSLLVAATGAVITPRAAAGDDIVLRFQQRYHGLTSVRCSFAGSPGPRGTLVAVRGGKFRLETSDRIIVSDGKAVYNATPSSKTVIINRFNPKATDVSIERMFFDILTVYRATASQGAGNSHTLRLLPPSPTAIVSGVRELTATIDASSMNISRLVATTDSGQYTFTISNLKVNRSVPPSAFTYAPPSGWEVIDLR
jgi:outer membrane lipoprotein-sorting protein